MPHIPHSFDFIHIKSVKDLPHLFIVLLLVSGIGIGVYLSLQPQLFSKQAAEGNIIDVSFLPEIIEAKVGESYDLKIGINPKGQRVTAAKLIVKYDPQVVSIAEVQNGGYLPVTLKVEDDFNGKLTLVYGSTIDSKSPPLGLLSLVKLRIQNPYNSEVGLDTDSEINIATQEDNVLNNYPKLTIEALNNQSEEDAKYPNNLLQEKPFFASSQPTVDDFQKSMEERAGLKPGRIDPEFSEAYIKQLAGDAVSPIVALNKVLQEKVGDVLGK